MRSTDPRKARKVGSDPKDQERDKPVTHEFLALILGVRRQTVSVVVSQLSQQGWLVYRRGIVEIIDRVGLEGATCECYEIIRDEFARLVGPPLPRAHRARAAAKSL